MPKILSYTPPWLARPSPGSGIFSETLSPLSSGSPSRNGAEAARTNGNSSNHGYEGPCRLLAHRGTEIFAVAGNKIRWADLRRVKDDWHEATNGQSKTRNSNKRPVHRELAVPVFHEIRQIIISPSEQFLAVVTKHTIHIAVLPDSSHLREIDRSPLKLKTYQLGPTTHVIPQPPLISALWHPLAASTTNTDCLVTITGEAALRVWELDRMNHWSFDKPALAIDLKKLADGRSYQDDFEPTSFGKSRGFSADSFDMDVASACFGGSGLEEEDGWAAMTLWVSMRNGDLYALCPLLPSRWRASSTTVPALTTSVVSKMSCIEEGGLVAEERQTIRQQYEWVQQLDQDNPSAEPGHNDETRQRPTSLNQIPKLQGPFEIDIGNEAEELDVKDIFVIAPKLDVEELLSEDEEYFARISELAQDSSDATIVCIATMEGNVHVLLDVEGVSGQWLPKSTSGTFVVPEPDFKELLLVESVLSDSASEKMDEHDWPMFAGDPLSRYNVYLTTAREVKFLSLAEWASRLDDELFLPPTRDERLEFRVRTVCEGTSVLQESIVNLELEELKKSSTGLSAPIVFEDQELGYMLLSMLPGQPYAACFDQLEFSSNALALGIRAESPELTSWDLSQLRESSPANEMLTAPHDPYDPPRIFYEQPTAPLKHFLTLNVPQRQRLTLKQEIKLSPATMNIMTSAHRIISGQTSQLEDAAADLFRRCERLREDLSDQVKTMSELAERMQHISTGGADSDVAVARPSLGSRIDGARERQRSLNERHEALRRKVARAGTSGRELSAKELVWAREISDMAQGIHVDINEPDGEYHEDRVNDSNGDLDDRLEKVSADRGLLCLRTH